MSSGGGTTVQNTNSAPWAPIQPYLTDVASQAQALSASQQGNTQLPSTFAPFSQQTQGALQAGQNYGQGAGTDLMNNASGSLASLQNGNGPGQGTQQMFANPGNINPFLDAQFSAASKPVIDAVNAQFGMGGRTGSAANQQLLTRNLGDLASNIYGNGYDSAANRSLSASQGLSGTALSADQASSGVNAGAWQNIMNQLGIGATYDSQDQAQLQDQQNQYLYAQQQPWNILDAYSGDVTGIGGLGGTSAGTSKQPGSMAPALGAAGSVAAAALMVF